MLKKYYGTDICSIYKFISTDSTNKEESFQNRFHIIESIYDILEEDNN